MNKVALIGYGYWGKKLYQALSEVFSKKNIVVVDPFIKNVDHDLIISDLKQILEDKNIDHVFISTPEETHFGLAKECLINNKNTFIEKPLCLYKKEAVELQELAETNHLKLFVDYTFIFDPFVKKIKLLIDDGTLGKLLHIDSIRHSVNISKPNVSVFDDLATHDIYLGRYFFGKNVNTFTTVKNYIDSKQVNQATVNFNYGSRQNMTSDFSWVQPTPERKMTFICDQATIVWDKKQQMLQIYKSQKLTDEIAVEASSSPLELAVRDFISIKENIDYSNDVALLEKLNQN